MRALAIIGCLLLSGCYTDQHVYGRGENGGYVFVTDAFPRTEMTIRYVIYPDIKSLRKAAKDYGLETWQPLAFSTISRGVCTIHAVDPKKKFETESLGHEFLHCAYGQWHRSNTSNGEGSL